MPEALNNERLKARWPFGRFPGAKSKAEAAKTAGALFPLTPALSLWALWEREKHSPVPR